MEAASLLFSQKDIHSVTISDIAQKANVAKGTFYLYFKDKYEIQDVLIMQACNRLLNHARQKLNQNDIQNFEDAVIFIIDSILNDLESDHILMKFIEKNLSFSLFSSQMQNTLDDVSLHLKDEFKQRALQNGYDIPDPDVVLYMIVDMTGSTCYNSILFNQPVPIEEFKPYLFQAIRSILRSYKKKEAESSSLPEGRR